MEEKIVSLKKDAETNIHMKKNEIRLLPYIIYKITPKWTKDLNKT
jgi:hypothetical protein